MSDPIKLASELADNTIEMIVGKEKMRAGRLQKIRDIQEQIEILRTDIRHAWDRYATMVSEVDRSDMESIEFFFESDSPRRMQIRADIQHLDSLMREREETQRRLDGQAKQSQERCPR